MARLVIFLSTLIILVVLEIFYESKERTFKRIERWPGNIFLILVSNVSLKLLLPLGLIGFSTLIESKGLGFFNQTSIALELPLSLILLDLFIWLQHVITHKVSWLWKFHRVHHSDVELDATSALRFHPLEIIFSLLIKMVLILTFGFSAEAILIFEIILSSAAMFNHANIHIPKRFEKILRFFIVTPQMHLIHHNVDQKLSDTNYGFNLSIWDRIFRTYTESQSETALIGQRNFRTVEDQSILSLIVQPFKKS